MQDKTRMNGFKNHSLCDSKSRCYKTINLTTLKFFQMWKFITKIMHKWQTRERSLKSCHQQKTVSLLSINTSLTLSRRQRTRRKQSCDWAQWVALGPRQLCLYLIKKCCRVCFVHVEEPIFAKVQNDPQVLSPEIKMIRDLGMHCYVEIHIQHRFRK